MREPEYFLGKPVQSLQTMLRHIADADSRVLPLIPDGYYGPNTYASVLSFQQAYGLPETGQVDPETWDRIVAIHDMVFPNRVPPVTSPIWSAGQVIEPGQSNNHLYLVQAMLTVLAKFFPTLEAPPINGVLDPSTAAGLRWLQRASGLPETGALNTATWHSLNNLYRVTTSNGQPIGSSVG